MKFTARRLTVIGIAAIAAVTMSGCSAGSTPPPASDKNKKVSITVGDRPTADQAAARTLYDAQVAAFSKAHPNITVTPSETVWDAQTFQASVAAGTLPTVYKVPFTEIQSLISRKQVANVTDEITSTGLTDDLNPQTAKIVQDSSGGIWGVPVLPYAIGLIYNRDLFTKAGLDPDKPPTTWKQVRTDAAAIAKATGQAGYAQMSTNNTGGWMLAVQTYSMGGSIENKDGSKATFDGKATNQALDYLQRMRWEDNSMGSNFLYDMSGIAKDFAAGKIGMFLAVPSAAYNGAVVHYKMPKDQVGLTAVPTGPGNDNSVLAGGSVEIFNPKATKAQISAALEWVHFFDLDKYTNEKAAKADAKATAADGSTVGIPRISPVKPSDFAKYEKWIAADVNVDLDNMKGYTDNLNTVKLKTEPVNNAQEIYGMLDAIVQQVLTQQDSNIDNLLSDAVVAANSKLARSGK